MVPQIRDDSENAAVFAASTQIGTEMVIAGVEELRN